LVEPIMVEVEGYDPVYGQGTFIFLKGVASLAAGDVVTYDSAGQSIRALTTSRGPIAVAMAAVPATSWGWFMRKGTVLVNSGANATVASAAAQCSAAGTIDDTTTAGQFIDGMTTRAVNSGGFTLCSMSNPYMFGR
jgi:hypothetical protein